MEHTSTPYICFLFCHTVSIWLDCRIPQNSILKELVFQHTWAGMHFCAFAATVTWGSVMVADASHQDLKDWARAVPAVCAVFSRLSNKRKKQTIPNRQQVTQCISVYILPQDMLGTGGNKNLGRVGKSRNKFWGIGFKGVSQGSFQAPFCSIY